MDINQKESSNDLLIRLIDGQQDAPPLLRSGIARGTPQFCKVKAKPSALSIHPASRMMRLQKRKKTTSFACTKSAKAPIWFLHPNRRWFIVDKTMERENANYSCVLSARVLIFKCKVSTVDDGCQFWSLCLFVWTEHRENCKQICWGGTFITSYRKCFNSKFELKWKFHLQEI